MSILRYPLVLAAILSLVSLFADPIALYLGPFDYTGHLTYEYSVGDDVIVNVVFQLDEFIGERLIVISSPSPWQYTQSGTSISFSGGGLSSGDSLIAPVSFKEYVNPGEYFLSTIGTTSKGDQVTASGILLVTEMIMLKIVYLLKENQLYLLAGTTILLIGDIILGRRKKPAPIVDTGVKTPVETTTTRTREGGILPPTVIDSVGDDPRDIPPPIIYGEEIEADLQVPPVYIVSDFHVGSNRNFPRQTNKQLSNDFHERTLKSFLEWLEAVNRDSAGYDHYDIVMNGDFLDLWQAARPSKDTYENRLNDILETNVVNNTNFFSQLGGFIRRNSPRCRFYYLIGNHDDPLYSGDSSGDKLFGEGNSFNSNRNIVKLKLRDGTTSLMSFAFNKQYTNTRYQLFVEHGHQHDSTNLKDENGEPSGGQRIAQHINHMQELDPNFGKIENTPNQETAKYLSCLNKREDTPQSVKDEIEKLKDISIDAESYFIGNIVDFLLTDNMVSSLIIDRIEPSSVKANELKEALKIINDTSKISSYKIVVFGHTHLHDLQPTQPYSSWAHANTGTWIDDITFSSTNGCTLTSSPSHLPYVKISKQEGEEIALVELKFFSGNSADRLVRVRLQ
jgi:UDP-2,3-diacylglucosamine pyrophosphatase LpxH